MTPIRNRVLICGSRLATPDMFTIAWRLVRAVKWRNENLPSLFGAFINVGDAGGVDFAVVAACNQFGVDYMCWGITATGRNPIARHYTCTWQGKYSSVAYPERDRQMVRASSHCIGLHNVASPSHGTELTCEYAGKVLQKGNARILHFDPLTGKVSTDIL